MLNLHAFSSYYIISLKYKVSSAPLKLCYFPRTLFFPSIWLNDSSKARDLITIDMTNVKNTKTVGRERKEEGEINSSTYCLLKEAVI